MADADAQTKTHHGVQPHLRRDAIVSLTDSSGGTASDTIAAHAATVTAVDGTGTNAAGVTTTNAQLVIIRNSVASLAAKIEELQDALREAGITAV